MSKSPQIDQDDHEELHGQHNEHIVQVEAGVSIVEREKSIDRQLRSKIVILAGQHLLSHTSSDFGGEIENCAKP